jgi:hypothetical protein
MRLDQEPRFDPRAVLILILIVILVIFGFWYVRHHMVGTHEHPKVTLPPK